MLPCLPGLAPQKKKKKKEAMSVLSKEAVQLPSLSGETEARGMAGLTQDSMGSTRTAPLSAFQDLGSSSSPTDSWNAWGLPHGGHLEGWNRM